LFIVVADKGFFDPNGIETFIFLNLFCYKIYNVLKEKK